MRKVDGRRIAASLGILIGLTLSACQSGGSNGSSTSPSPVGVALRCKLPISNGVPGSGGFISFPEAIFTADKASHVTLPGPALGGRQAFGLSYDRASAKWLPVPPDWVSPDGTRYAYPSADAIEVISVATGTVVNELGKGHSWQVLDLENGGVYAYIVKSGTTDWPPTAASGGLWVFPYTSSVHEIENTSVPVAVKGTIGYFVDTYTPAQPTTSSVSWINLGGNGRGISFSPFRGFGMGSDEYTLVGVAANGLVFGWLTDGELWYAKENNLEHKLDLGGDSARLGLNSYSVLSDDHGTWIAGAKHLYLLTANGRLAGAGDHTGSIAGSCF